MKIELKQYNYSQRSLNNNRFLKEISALVVGIILLMVVLFAITQ